VDGRAFICNFELVKEVEDRCVCAALPAEAMLVWVEDIEVLPYMLDSPGDHASPHFPDYFEEGDRTDFAEVVDSWFFGE
jgi:hypothetical protein